MFHEFPRDAVSVLLTLASHQQGLFALVFETQQKEKKVESPGSVGVAPGDTIPGAGVHHSGATGRTAGSTGDDTQGLGVSGMRVGSRGVVNPGLNPRVFYEDYSSGSERVALRDVGPQAGAHQSDAAGGAVGGTGGNAQGLGVSSTRVGSSSLLDLGLNPV